MPKSVPGLLAWKPGPPLQLMLAVCSDDVVLTFLQTQPLAVYKIHNQHAVKYVNSVIFSMSETLVLNQMHM